MKNFTIFFPDSSIGTLPEEFIDSFVFSTDINKMFSISKIILKDFCQKYFNLIKVGMDVDVTLRVRPREDCKENLEQFTNKMKVYSFNKLPGSETPLVDSMELTLISSWYFINGVGTSVYSGSVGEILSGLCEVIRGNGGNFTRGDFHSATSDPGRRRYQINEKLQDFMKRILNYGYIGTKDAQNKLTAVYPLYLYTDSRNNLNLRCLGDFLEGSVRYAYLPDKTTLAYNKSAINRISGLQSCRIKAFKVFSANKPLTSSCTTYFTTAGFTSTAAFQAKNKMINSENNNPSVDTVSPSAVKYKDWTFTPQDAFATSIKEYCEENLNTFSLMVTMDGFRLDEARLGNLVQVLLPGENNTGDTATISDGGYVVKKVEYIYRDNLPSTRIELFLAKYSSTI